MLYKVGVARKRNRSDQKGKLGSKVVSFETTYRFTSRYADWLENGQNDDFELYYN